MRQRLRQVLLGSVIAMGLATGCSNAESNGSAGTNVAGDGGANDGLGPLDQPDSGTTSCSCTAAPPEVDVVPCARSGGDTAAYAEKTYTGKTVAELARVSVVLSTSTDPDATYTTSAFPLQIQSGTVRVECTAGIDGDYTATFILP